MKKVSLLLLTAIGLLTASTVYEWFFLGGRRMYTWLSPFIGARDITNCDMRKCIQYIANMSDQGPIKVGACDLFMYNSGVAVAGFLCFLLIYFLFVFFGSAITGVAPRGARKSVLILWSVLFLFIALPLRPALWIVEFVLGLFVITQLQLSSRVRAVMIGMATVLFYSNAGRYIVASCATEFFSVSRIYIQPTSLGRFHDAVNTLFVTLHLGQLDMPRMHDQGFPYLFLALAFLLKTFRRLLWLCYDLWTERTVSVNAADFLIFMIGLPSLIGNAATPSFRDFSTSYGKGPDSTEGAQTMAVCIGGCTLLYTVIVMAAYFPGVRVLFPRCDLATAGPVAVWMRLITTLVIDYLFLLATEQGSVGVARLFGYGLRDNYDRPLLARNMADFWRRWNIFWREYVVAAFYLPTVLTLARWNGKARRWHVVPATMMTFFATFALNLLPLALLSGSTPFYVPQATQPGPGIVEKDLPVAVVNFSHLEYSLGVYYLAEGILVCITLLIEFGRRKTRMPAAESPLIRCRHIVAVVCTLFTVAALRCFQDANFNLWDQCRFILHAFGIKG